MGRNKFSRCEWKLSYANKVNLHFKIHQIAKACLNNCKIHFSLKAKKERGSRKGKPRKNFNTFYSEFFPERWPKKCFSFDLLMVIFPTSRSKSTYIKQMKSICICISCFRMHKGRRRAWSWQLKSLGRQAQLSFIIICMEICKSVAKANVKHDSESQSAFSLTPDFVLILQNFQITCVDRIGIWPSNWFETGWKIQLIRSRG